MVIARIARHLPHTVKHPLLVSSGWLWNRRGLPAQSRRDISIIKEELLAVRDHKLQVFEWGSGRSTIFYAKLLHSAGREFDWYAVDNSPEWFERSRSEVVRARLSGQVHVYCSEFPAFWQIPGYNYSNVILPNPWSDSASVADYVNLPKKLEIAFDLIVVDGRFRRRCLQIAKEVLAPNGVVILHDADRTHYHPPLSDYPHVQFLTTGHLPGTRQKSTIALCRLAGVSKMGKLI